MFLCPNCGEEINQSSEICPHCNFDLTQSPETEPKPPRPLRKILLIWAVIIAAIAGLLWGFLWFVLPAQRGDPTLRSEAGAIAALHDLRAALVTYAAAQPDGAFPASLEQIGDRARADAQLAQSVGYQITYTPVDPGSDGVVRGFSLIARAGNYGYRNFFLDQSGAIRATRENRAATSHDPPI